jgi:hypothetical protein
MNRNQLTAATRAQLARTRLAVPRLARPHRAGGWPVGARRPAGRHVRQRPASTHRAVSFTRRLAIALAAMAMVAIGLATMVEA